MMKNCSHLARRFLAERDGAIAIMFALVGLVLLAMIGGVIDYTRSINERSRLQSALDATGLALVHLPNGTPADVVQQRAQEFFTSVYKATPGVPTPRLGVNPIENGVRLEASNDVPLSILALAGVNRWTIGAKSQTNFARNKVEIALVLDNSGSMNYEGKIEALKSALNTLITQLQASIISPGDVKISVVPFNSQVNIGTGFASSNALRFDVDIKNPSILNFFSFYSIPLTPPTPIDWPGCIVDRDDSYFDFDTKSDPPNAITNSKYVASYCQDYPTNPPIQGQQIIPMKTLTADLENVRAVVNSMAPQGATNNTIGLVTGLSTLRSDTPFGGQSVDDEFTRKFLIQFTDGRNTQNRFKGYGSGGYDINPEAALVDERFQKACNNAKFYGKVTIFTVGLGGGANDLLRSCATDPAAHYFPITSASQIASAFQSILEQITKIRTTR